MRRFFSPIVGLCALCVTAAGAHATDVTDDGREVGTKDIVFEAGVGGLYSPIFEGSSKYTFTPYPIFKLHYLRIPGLYETGKTISSIYISPSFRYIGDRSRSDDRIVRGLNNVDWALEVGLTLGYETEHFHTFVSVRRGFNGHEGWVAELGADGILRPTDELTLKLGPRLSFASENYMDTYFSVSPAETITSGYAAFNPSGGIKSAGITGQIEYALTREVTLYGRASWDRLIGDAADSPIVKAGDENMFGAGIGISYRFGLDLYD